MLDRMTKRSHTEWHRSTRKCESLELKSDACSCVLEIVETVHHRLNDSCTNRSAFVVSSMHVYPLSNCFLLIGIETSRNHFLHTYKWSDTARLLVFQAKLILFIFVEFERKKKVMFPLDYTRYASNAHSHTVQPNLRNTFIDVTSNLMFDYNIIFKLVHR